MFETKWWIADESTSVLLFIDLITISLLYNRFLSLPFDWRPVGFCEIVQKKFRFDLLILMEFNFCHRNLDALEINGSKKSITHALAYYPCANCNGRKKSKIWQSAIGQSPNEINWKLIAQTVAVVFCHSFLFVSLWFRSDNRYDCDNRYVTKKKIKNIYKSTCEL